MAKHVHPPPSLSKVLRTAVIWFVIGGLGSMLLFWLSGGWNNSD